MLNKSLPIANDRTIYYCNYKTKYCQMSMVIIWFLSSTNNQWPKHWILPITNRHEICKKNYTAAGFSGQKFTPLILPNFNSFGDNNTKTWVKMEKFSPLAKILHCRWQWRQWQISPLITNDQNIAKCWCTFVAGPAGADDWLGGSSTKSKSHFGLLFSP